MNLFNQFSAASSKVGIDPWNYPIDKLTKIRGSLWTARCNLPMGVRPNQDDNILASDFIESYSPSDRVKIYEALKKRKYTHIPVGSFIDIDAYHGQYTPVDIRNAGESDRIAGIMKEVYANGIIPVFFLSPDNYTLDQMVNELEPIFSQKIWQDLIRIVIPSGWEPSQDRSNQTYVDFFKWAERVFPKKDSNGVGIIQGLHMTADFDCPGNNDDLTPSSPSYIGMAKCWENVSKYLHLYFIQNGPYGVPVKADPVTFTNFCNQFKDVSGSLWQRFNKGYAGWPTSSKFGNGIPIKLVAAEFCSYTCYWQNFPESDAQDYGQGALDSGAYGVMDGFHHE